MLSPDSSIIIVGGGVFGLSTALHLARGGYTDITIFDRCAFDKNHYNPLHGCDGASADINKIFRASYAGKEHYQGLAIEARDEWLAWNKDIRESAESDLPVPITPADKLLDVCGVYYLGDGPVLREHYAQSLQTMEKFPHFRSQQFLKNSTEDEERLRNLGGNWIKKYHIIDNVNGGDTNGFLDTAGGIMIADKACTYALFLCKQLGVKFVLGDPQGKLETLISETKGSEKNVTGIKTCDGQTYHADLVVVACGAWTATVLPEASRVVEATSGGTLFIDVPKERQGLWEKFRSDNYPVWHFRKGTGDTYYEGGSFPISSDGRLKFGFRGKKFTNFQPHPTQRNLRVSTPRTKYTSDTIDTVPLHGLELVKSVIGQAFPELREFGFTDSRLCWYTDSIDNEFVIDYVPGYADSLFVCTGGSGHGFKFLPVLGRYVKLQLERVPSQFSKRWQWRTVQEGKASNGLEEGEDGPRDIKKQKLAAPSDFKFAMETSSKL